MMMEAWTAAKEWGRRMATEYFHGVYKYRGWVCALWIIGILSVFDIAAAEEFKFLWWEKIIFTVSVAGLKAALLMAVLICLFRYRWVRPIGWLIVGIYGALALTNLISYHFYEFGISRKLILILAQTTPAETQGFLPQLLSNIGHSFSSIWVWVGIGAAILSFYIFHILKRKALTVIVCIASFVGVASFGIFALTNSSGRTATALTLRIAKYGREVALWNQQFKELQNQKRELPYKESVASRHLAKTVIVVIGESASRNHHSIYGYPLPTTPNLDRNKESLFLFTNAIGSSAATSGNMERILSLKPDDATSGDGLSFPLLIDLFNQAGYKTFWLSNQERMGSVSNTSGVMVSGASVVKYAGADNSEDRLVVKFDEILLRELATALRDTTPDKLIFLHLLGSHVDYKRRYPESFNKFKAKDEMQDSRSWLSPSMAATVGQYDNSILYTDHILNQVMQITNQQPDAALMVYFSDHGENVYEEDGYSGRGERYVEVPFFIYPNPSYRKENPQETERLRQAVDRKFSTANFVHLLMSLTGTTYQLYDASRDVSSPQFKERKRFVDEKIWKYE